jgi:hypothetical protein
MFSRALMAMSIFDDANAFSYSDEGHVFIQYNFPAGDQTWVFDATTKLFHKKQSWKSDETFGRHRANCYGYFNNRHYVGDYANGKIYEMSQDFYSDDGEEIRREAYTKEVDMGIKPQRMPPFQVIVESGVGLESGLDPQIMMRYSNDGGNVWSNELWRSAGKIGEYRKKAVWQRVGSASKRMNHIAVTAPILWRILGVDTGGGQ